MKKFNVQYNTTTHYESVVKANTIKEAKEKVIEVIGDPIIIEDVYEIN